MSKVLLGCVVGGVVLTSAILAKHADEEGEISAEDMATLYIRERTAELISEGLDAKSAHEQATGEAAEAVASVT